MPTKSPKLTPIAQEAVAGLGTQLRTRRKQLKVSATAASEAAGISRPTLYRIEQGNPSVTLGALASAALSADMSLQLVVREKEPPVYSRKGWIPAAVPLADYPALKALAWHVQGLAELTPKEAWQIYQRNERHLDRDNLTESEQDLIDALRTAFERDHGI